MIRLPVTGINISQTDLNQHLSQLDIYQGLLEKGFKKDQIVRYINEQGAREQQQRKITLLSPPGPASLSIQLSMKAIENDSPEAPEAATSPVLKDDPDLQAPPELEVHKKTTRTATKETESERPRVASTTTAQHAARHSSLLRYAYAPSSDSSLDVNLSDRPTFPPWPVRYRPRSLTYSYDQSVPDDEDCDDGSDHEDTVIDKFEHIIIDDEIVEERKSTKSSTPITPMLSAEAEAFVPRLANSDLDDKGKARAGAPEPPSVDSSSPCLLPTTRRVSTPQLPAYRSRPIMITPPRNLSQQYLDNSFRVYNDSRPSHDQPQTPIDIERSACFSHGTAAHSAPPGMPLSSAHREFNSELHDGATAISDHSPVRRIHLMRLRRQREFERSTRIEDLRIDRARTRDASTAGDGFDGARDEGMLERRMARLWRDEFDADGVGVENEETFSLEWTGNIRAVSGNRRAA